MRTILIIPQGLNPRNYASAVRSLEAFGGTEVWHPYELSFKPLNRITTGLHRHIRKVPYRDYDEIVTWCRNERIKLVSVENVEGSGDLRGFRFPPNVAIVMGHEGDGVVVPAPGHAEGFSAR